MEKQEKDYAEEFANAEVALLKLQDENILLKKELRDAHRALRELKEKRYMELYELQHSNNLLEEKVDSLLKDIERVGGKIKGMN